MRKYMFQLALAATLFVISADAQPRTAAQQQFPGRSMPPDIVAPADSRPVQAPKPERNPLPQSDQPAKAAPHPASPTSTQAQQPTAARKARKHPAKPSPMPAPEPVAQAPASPPPPPTLQQMPPSAPQVQYRDGLLTISANNSTLLDVLNAVGAQTGANVTAPPAASAARLFLQIGPAPPRDVLSRLLAGTNLDYLLAGSPDDPNALRQVIITQRQGGPAVAQNPNPPRPSPLPGMGNPAISQEDDEQPVQQPQPQQGMPGGFVAPGGPGPFQPNPANAPPSVANPTPFPQTPGPTGVAPVQPPSQPPQQPPGQVKSPEQLLQEIRQMQQRQQQQQQQQQKPPQ